MTGTVILFVAFVIFTVHAVDPFDCSKDGKCAPGLRCEGGTCVLRTDCPMLSMPRLKSGCTMLTVVDERGCPMPKIVCSKENLKCGAIYCEPGYECDHDTTTPWTSTTVLFPCAPANLTNPCDINAKKPPRNLLSYARKTPNIVNVQIFAQQKLAVISIRCQHASRYVADLPPVCAKRDMFNYPKTSNRVAFQGRLASGN
nr:unnamed protein product [Haemonchus contortus]